MEASLARGDEAAQSRKKFMASNSHRVRVIGHGLSGNTRAYVKVSLAKSEGVSGGAVGKCARKLKLARPPVRMVRWSWCPLESASAHAMRAGGGSAAALALLVLSAAAAAWHCCVMVSITKRLSSSLLSLLQGPSSVMVG